MKISLNWLEDFVKFNESDPQKIADAITAHTAEVDEVIMPGAMLKNCCVGKVTNLRKHPGADRLSLCDVETDKGAKQVVCGGTNLVEGMYVAFAHVGAKVKFDGKLTELTKAKIRGETSEGMICAAEELGLEDLFPAKEADGKHPVINLSIAAAKKLGTSLQKYLDLTDTVIDIDNHAITNRPDLFSHVGFARECNASGIAKWHNKPTYKAPAVPKDVKPLKVKNDCPKMVTRYCACVIEIDEVGQTPYWMKQKLEATGWRSLNLPVDITNIVLMEVGMPLHCFDLDDLKGDMVMRQAKRGEKITTLDEAERELPEGAIVISDDEGIFDLLGVMGGLRSSTKTGTKRLLLHSAAVDPVSVRKTIIATGHRTDASTVYEKGISPVVVEQGFYRALELILELVPGAKIVSKIESWGDDGKAEPIKVTVEQVQSMLGVDIPVKRMLEILTALEFEAKEVKGVITATPPLHRLKDINGPHDLAEEIGRIYGYNNIAATMPAASIEPPKRDHRTRQIRLALKELGFTEWLPLCLLSPQLLEKCNLDPAKAAEIENPIGEEVSLMQPCALPRLLDLAQLAVTQTEGDLKAFHIGTIFNKDSDRNTALGMIHTPSGKINLKNTPVLQLKNELIKSLKAAGHTVSFNQTGEYSAAHPGRYSQIVLDSKPVGHLFELHPEVRTRFELPERTAVVLFDLTKLLESEPAVTIAQHLSQYPQVSYDVTVTKDHSGTIGETISQASKQSELLESIETVDTFEGGGLEAGKYNLTVRCTYRAADRTLTEDEAKTEHAKVLAVLEQ